ncbi:MAG: type II secretion system protein N [Psychromonas sp.]|nr:type II secretion system protein N [Psychromonas sp.]
MNYLTDNKKKVISFFVILYLIFIVVQLPAKIIPYFIPNNAGVRLTGLEGSLWNGEAVQLSYKNQYEFTRVKWSVSWFSLFLLKIKLNVSFNNYNHQLSGKGAVSMGFFGISLDDVIVKGDAKEIINLSKQNIPAKISGPVSIVIKEAKQGKPYCSELNAQINWKNSSVISDFGSIKLNNPIVNVQCDKGEVVARLIQDSNEITVNATARLKAGYLYQLKGSIKGKNKLDPSIKKAIGWIGPKAANGSTPFSIRGKL